MKLYVGNLPWSATQDDLMRMFEPMGEVISANVIMDRETGRSRGFGFVEVDAAAGKRAIDELNGKDMDGRALKVNEANEKPRRDSRY